MYFFINCFDFCTASIQMVRNLNNNKNVKMRKISLISTFLFIRDKPSKMDKSVKLVSFLSVYKVFMRFSFQKRNGGHQFLILLNCPIVKALYLVGHTSAKILIFESFNLLPFEKLQKGHCICVKLRMIKPDVSILLSFERLKYGGHALLGYLSLRQPSWQSARFAIVCGRHWVRTPTSMIRTYKQEVSVLSQTPGILK